MRNRKYTHITIGGVDYSAYMRTPLTIQRTLNDQLDSAVVELHNTPFDEPLTPFQPVKLGDESYILAEDVVTETLGRGLYKHSLTLIEQTKEAERIICGAKAFTRPLVHDYSDGQTLVELVAYSSNNYIAETRRASDLSSPKMVGQITLGMSDFWFGFDGGIIEGDTPIVNIYYDKTNPVQFVDPNPGDDDGSRNLLKITGTSVRGTLSDDGTELSFDASKAGVYAVFVEYGSYSNFRGVMTQIFVYEQPIAKPTLTVAEVINRLLETAETLRDGLDTARYRLEYTQEQADIMSQPAPELHLPNSRSLWENLREIGKYIHAIPRITDGVLTFDQLGGTEYADMSNGQRVAQTSSLNIGDYTAGLDSLANNLINQDDLSDGSVTDPWDGGYITMRANEEEARIQEGTGVLLTTHPVEKIVKLEMAPFSFKGKTFPSINLTSFVFEKQEYDVLSNYTGGFPSSKSFALYYTQGGKNIEGFWFKSQTSASEIINALEDYALTNIIEVKTGLQAGYFDTLPYTDLSFRITYIPSVTARVRHYKPDYSGDFPSVMVHNQSANKLSAKAFGENLRGQLAMMSNTSDTVTYLFRRMEDLPRAGTLYDEDRYITSITARIYNDFVVAQMSLAEGYNELGAFVEVNNAIRQFEIPASEDRYTVLEEFCMVSSTPHTDDENTAAKTALKNAILGGLSVNATGNDASLALVDTYDYNGYKITDTSLALPVTTLALGTSLYFGFRFEDNYAAGRKSVAGGEKYRYQDYVPYADKFYAEAKTLSFSLMAGAKGGTDTPNSLPESTGVSGGTAIVSVGNDYPILWHKDSADAGCITYQLHMVTDSGFILGDGLTYWCEAVRKQPSPTWARIYFYKERINQLTGTTNTGAAFESHPVFVNKTDGKIYHNGVPQKFASWAIIKNGRFIIGKNSSELTDTIYFSFQRRLKS